ncbi:MAG: hypothetical protein V4722_21685 [Bacteroidota bacterium]
MKNWSQTAKAYTEDHLSKSLAQPERRLNALSAIENKFKEEFPYMLRDENVFRNIQKIYLSKLYECLKGKPLSSAEESVFTGLYKFCN